MGADRQSSVRDADVVVVGSGLGGLTAAAYLAAAGRRVVVVERHNVAGGNGTVFTHSGYEFDVGIHYLGDVGPGGVFDTVLGPLGIDIAWRPLDAAGFETYQFGDGMVFRVPAGAEPFRARLHETFPEERIAIDEYLDTIVALRDGLAGRGHAELLLDLRSTTLGDWFDARHVSRRLRAVLAGEHGTYALPPSRVSMLLHAGLVGHYLDGGYYPEGGGQVFADALIRVIRQHGGDIIVRSPVDRVIVEDGEVRGVHLLPPSPDRRRGVPELIHAPVVVSNADLKRTVFELVGPEEFPPEFVARVGGYAMTLPLFVVYLVIDRDLRAEGHPNTNVFVYPHDDIEADYAALAAGAVPEEPFAYLTFASLKDPANPRLCRPGQTNLQAMTLTPGTAAFWGLPRDAGAGERYRRNPGYLARRADIHDRVMRVAETAIPGLRDVVVHDECATAMTHERFTRSTNGTSYGIEATPEQFLFDRPPPTTPVAGLYLCGASTIRGHGVAGVMAGGVMAASAILGAPAADLIRDRLVRDTLLKHQFDGDRLAASS